RLPVGERRGRADDDHERDEHADQDPPHLTSVSLVRGPVTREPTPPFPSRMAVEMQRRRRTEPDEAPLDDDGPGRGTLEVVQAALVNANRDHVPNLAAALAYYAFLAIPASLLLAVGLFGLLASPDDVTTLVDKLGSVIPGQATDLLRSNLQRMTAKHSTG